MNDSGLVCDDTRHDVAHPVEAEETAGEETTEKREQSNGPQINVKEMELPVERAEQIRLMEAILFASAEPLDMATLAVRFPPETDLLDLLEDLRERYASRGVNLVQRGGKWAFRTAPDLAPLLRVEREVPKQLSRAAVETLAIIAYHQPVTRAEIEAIRGVSTSKGTLDLLMEQGWIKPGRRRNTPGRPVTWVSTPHFLDSFGLEDIRDLPGIADLKAAGLMDKRPAIETLSQTTQDDALQSVEQEDEVERDEDLVAMDTDELLKEDEE